MLLPDNIHPENTIYYNGSFVLKALQEESMIDLLDLYIVTQKSREMSMSIFVLCLDWLFLLNIVSFDEQGMITLCS